MVEFSKCLFNNHQGPHSGHWGLGGELDMVPAPEGFQVQRRGGRQTPAVAHSDGIPEI